MKAMIFAAGMGSRLRPLTDMMPKALVPVAGIPMLERVILRLKTAGFEDITINVHYLGMQIMDFLQAKENFGITIHISDESMRLLDTGGGIKKARAFLDGNEPFLVHNVDILCDIDLLAFYHHHLKAKADATLLTNHRDTSRYMLVDDKKRIQGWINKVTKETLPKGLVYPNDKYHEEAFGGIHVMSPSIFHYMDALPASDKFSIIPFYTSICHAANIQTYNIDSDCWFDIGKPETLREAETYLSRRISV